MINHQQPLRVLRITDETGHQCSPLNQFSLPLRHEQQITFCTFFRVDIPITNEITVIDGNGTLFGFFGALRRALQRDEYDVVHVHSPHVGVFFLLACLFMPRARRLLRYSVYTVHSCYTHYKRRNKSLATLTAIFFRRTVCCSGASYDSFPRWLRRLAGRRMIAIQNGVDLNRLDQVVEQLPRQNVPHAACFTVAAVCRLEPLKNPQHIFQAFQQIEDDSSRMLFIGEGPIREAIASEAAALGNKSRVKLTGEVPRNEVYQRLMEADVFISASTREGLPVAVIEAMACGCPVVLSDIPPHREIADGCPFIPLVPVDDITGYAREIKRIKAMPSEKRAAIGRQCRQIVEERFSLADMHRRYLQVYESLHDDELPQHVVVQENVEFAQRVAE